LHSESGKENSKKTFHETKNQLFVINFSEQLFAFLTKKVLPLTKKSVFAYFSLTKL